MKKFICAVFFAAIVGGCGAGTSPCDCPEDDITAMDIFNLTYSGCVDLCKACVNWSNGCGEYAFDVTACTWSLWDSGKGNNSCLADIQTVNSWDTCSPDESWRCPQD